MTFTRSSLFIVAAVVLFVIAFLIAIAAIAGNGAAFIAAGLACFAASFLP
jgi:hypothetical protein